MLKTFFYPIERLPLGLNPFAFSHALPSRLSSRVFQGSLCLWAVLFSWTTPLYHCSTT